MTCATLQYAYALMTSPTRSISRDTITLLERCREVFAPNRASPLDSLTEVLLSRANASTLSVEAQIAMRKLGYDPYDGDLQHFYHGVLDAAFQGPRLEATDAYRASMRAHVDHVREGASKIVAEFSRKGDERFPEEYWQRVRKCPHCKDWIDAGLQDCPTCRRKRASV